MSLVKVTSGWGAACSALTAIGVTRPTIPVTSNPAPATRTLPKCFRTAISHTPWIPNYKVRPLNDSP